MSVVRKYQVGDRVKVARVCGADTEAVRSALGRTGKVSGKSHLSDTYVVELPADDRRPRAEVVVTDFHLEAVVQVPSDDPPPPAGTGPRRPLTDPELDRLLAAGLRRLEAREAQEDRAFRTGEANRRAGWARAVEAAAPLFGPLAGRLPEDPPADFRLHAGDALPATLVVRVIPFADRPHGWVGARLVREGGRYLPDGSDRAFLVPARFGPGAGGEPDESYYETTDWLAEAVALAYRAEDAWAETKRLLAAAPVRLPPHERLANVIREIAAGAMVPTP